MAIEKLKRHKSPGIDQIPTELIKVGGWTTCFEIHNLINSIWNKEKLLEQWKESIIVSSFLSTTYKILTNIPLLRSNTDHTYCIHQILEKKWEYNEEVHQPFIDFKKAYDPVRREVLYNILIQFGILMERVRLIKIC